MAIDRDGDGPPLRKDDVRTAKPSDELRASPFTEDVFDDEYYGRRPRRTGGISFGVVAGVVFMAAVVAAAGWYILAERSAPTTVAGEGEIVRADAAPYKVKPDDPGGLQVDNQDKLIYDRMAKGAPPKRVENLLPAPEEPRAPPVKAPEPAPAPKQQAAAETPASPTPEPKAATPDAKPEPKKEPDAAKPAEDPMASLLAEVQGLKKAPEPVAEPKSAPVPVSAPPTPPAAASPMLLVPAAESHSADTAVPEKPAVVADAAPAMPVPAPAAAVPAVAGPGPGPVYVQLVSARSEDGAMSEWKRISGKNPDLLAGLSPNVAQAEVPDKGTFFRLRAGPIADRATAQELCGSLIARGLTCLIVRP